MTYMTTVYLLSLLGVFHLASGYIIPKHSAGCRLVPHNGYALYGHNDKTLTATSATECQDTCLRDPLCLSIDVNHNTKTCFVSYSSADKAPKAYGRHTSSTYYQKQCGPVDNEDERDDNGSGHSPDQQIGGNCYETFGPFGSSSGHAFNDVHFAKMKLPVSGFTVRYGDYIDCLGLTYSGIKGECHGSTGGTMTAVNLRNREIITQVVVKVHRYVKQIKFVTNMRTYGPYGRDHYNAQTYTARGDALAYISGRKGSLLDNLALHFIDYSAVC